MTIRYEEKEPLKAKIAKSGLTSLSPGEFMAAWKLALVPCQFWGDTIIPSCKASARAIKKVYMAERGKVEQICENCNSLLGYVSEGEPTKVLCDNCKGGVQ